jgi:hypothetical protein
MRPNSPLVFQKQPNHRRHRDSKTSEQTDIDVADDLLIFGSWAITP